MDTLFASGSIMSRDLWKRMEAPYVTQIAERIHSHGMGILVYNCGNNPYFDVEIEAMQPEGMSIAYLPNECPTYADLKKTWGDQVMIVGILDPSNTLFMGTPATVKEAAKEQIQAMGPGGGSCFRADASSHPMPRCSTPWPWSKLRRNTGVTPSFSPTD